MSGKRKASGSEPSAKKRRLSDFYPPVDAAADDDDDDLAAAEANIPHVVCHAAGETTVLHDTGVDATALPHTLVGAQKTLFDLSTAILGSTGPSTILGMGKPGTGKTHVMRAVIQHLNAGGGLPPRADDSRGYTSRVLVVTPSHAVGDHHTKRTERTTIAALLGLGAGERLNNQGVVQPISFAAMVTRAVQYVARKYPRFAEMYFLLDELSQFSKLQLNIAHAAFSKLTGQRHLPFGGVRVIAFGDYAQLGSLDGASDGDEDAYIVPAHGDVEPTVCDSSSVFSADVFTTATFLPHIATVVLERNFRQSETDPLLGLLDHMRVGRVDLADWHLIQNLKVPSDKVDRDKILTMCTTVKVREEEQRRYKEQKLADGSEARTYIATRSILVNSRDVKKKLRASKITIFKGARVRYTSNELKLTDKKARLFNGLFGRVIEFRRDAVVVEFDNGVTAEINPTLVEVLGDKINVKPGEPKPEKPRKVLAWDIQIPLELCGAVTVQSVQGMTIRNDVVGIHLPTSLQPAGVYVAASRVPELSKLCFVGPSIEYTPPDPSAPVRTFVNRDTGRTEERRATGRELYNAETGTHRCITVDANVVHAAERLIRRTLWTQR